MNQIFGIITNIDLLNVHVNVQPDDNADQKILLPKWADWSACWKSVRISTLRRKKITEVHGYNLNFLLTRFAQTPGLRLFSPNIGMP